MTCTVVRSSTCSEAMRAQFSVIIPFYNEEAFLPMTLRSWIDQRRQPDEIILVDNASTDRSIEVARAELASFDGKVVYAADHRPGKINALETGCGRAAGDYVVLSDADTYYPPHYLALAEQLIDRYGAGVIAVMALRASMDAHRLSQRLRRRFYVLLSHILKKQAFTGGYGQIIRADALKKVGGFSQSLWPYVLLDHEIMQRLFTYGASRYHVDLWCVPSGRRADRSTVRWTLLERLLYHVVPFRFKDWFFYSFLGPRFAERGLTHLNLREKNWE